MKRRQKADLLGPISCKRTLKKGKGKEKKPRWKKRGEEKKSNGCTLGFCNGSFEDSFCPKKNCLTQKVRLAVTLSKISTFFISSHFLYLKQNSLEQLRVTIRQSGSSSSRTQRDFSLNCRLAFR